MPSPSVAKQGAPRAGRGAASDATSARRPMTTPSCRRIGPPVGEGAAMGIRALPLIVPRCELVTRRRNTEQLRTAGREQPALLAPDAHGAAEEAALGDRRARVAEQPCTVRG